MREAEKADKVFAGIIKSRVEAGANIISSDLVADGMIQLIEDDTKVGQVMRVNHQKGIHYKLYGKL